jgi:hypothetical protein
MPHVSQRVPEPAPAIALLLPDGIGTVGIVTLFLPVLHQTDSHVSMPFLMRSQTNAPLLVTNALETRTPGVVPSVWPPSR